MRYTGLPTAKQAASMKLTNLPPGTKQFEEVTKHITTSYPNACVMFIEKIEEHPNESAFQALKETITDPTEKILFHGTTESGAYSIAAHGYDPFLNKRAAFGKGTYFSANAIYSKHYMDITHTKAGFELSYMLLNKVLVGRTQIGSPNKEIDLSKADTQVDSLAKPTIFAVPRAEQAIPIYLIAFHKNAT